MSPDLLDAWSQLIDRWSTLATPDEMFRWSSAIDDDLVEYLLHGLEQCLKIGDVTHLLTRDDIDRNREFTIHLIDSMIGALQIEGRRCEHFADEMKELLAAAHI